jgi:integration host factor subunit beta
MKTVTKKELTDRVADSLKEKRSTVKVIVQQFLDRIVAELAKGNRLEFRDFGVFEVRIRKPRMAQNPRTLQRVPVPVKAAVKFKVGRRMKDRVQKGMPEPGAAKMTRHTEPAATSEVPPQPTA